MKTINLDQLQTFIAVLELGSFSAAAERLGVSQPAISLQVRQLEKRFGVALVERVGRRAAPTKAGTELAAHAERILSEVAATFDTMAHHGRGVTGRVRIGTGATACIWLLPPLLRQLRNRFPSLQIVVATGNTADVLRSLEQNTLDIGLVTLPATGRAFEIKPLLEDEFVAIAPPEMALPADITPLALADLPMIHFEGGNTRRIIDDWFARDGVPVRPVMSLDSSEGIKELVAAGLGSAILPKMALKEGSSCGPFTVRSLTPSLSRTLALVIRKDKVLSRGLREVVRSLETLST